MTAEIHGLEAGPARLSRWEHVLLGALLATLLGLHLVSAIPEGSIKGSDPQYYYAYLRSLVFDGDLRHDNELRHLTMAPRELGLRAVPRTGLPANKYGLGWALVALPTYLGAHLLYEAGVLPSSEVRTGYEVPYQIAATLGHVVAGWLGLVVLLRFLRRRHSPAVSWFATGCILGGTALLHYLVSVPAMAHAAGFLGVALLLDRTVALRRTSRCRPGEWLILGSLLGFLFITRYSNLVFGGMLLMLAPELRTWRLPGVLARGGLLFAGALPFLLVQGLAWKTIFGSWVVYPYGRESFDFLHPRFWSYGLSHRHGLLFFAPVTLLGGLGLAAAALRAPAQRERLAWIALGLPVALLFYLNASWHFWTFGHGFGCRSFIEAGPVLGAGLGVLLAVRPPALRALASGAATLATAWSLTLLALLHQKLLRTDGSTTLPQVLEAIFG